MRHTGLASRSAEAGAADTPVWSDAPTSVETRRRTHRCIYTHRYSIITSQSCLHHTTCKFICKVIQQQQQRAPGFIQLDPPSLCSAVVKKRLLSPLPLVQLLPRAAKTAPNYFCNNFVKPQSILISFGIRILQ